MYRLCPLTLENKATNDFIFVVVFLFFRSLNSRHETVNQWWDINNVLLVVETIC